jgi:3-deoxy-D-manno-octulosonic-acid transferase
MAEMLEEAGGGIRVSGMEDLYENIKTLLMDDSMRREMGNKARSFVERNRGALERVLAVIEESLISGGGKG